MTKPVNAIQIAPNGTVTPLLEPQTFDSIRETINGYVELIHGADGNTVIWCDEDAKPMNLPSNAVATALWWQVNPAAPHNDLLRGTVIITGSMDDDDTINPIPADVADQFAAWQSPAK